MDGIQPALPPAQDTLVAEVSAAPTGSDTGGSGFSKLLLAQQSEPKQAVDKSSRSGKVSPSPTQTEAAQSTGEHETSEIAELKAESRPVAELYSDADLETYSVSALIAGHPEDQPIDQPVQKIAANQADAAVSPPGTHDEQPVMTSLPPVITNEETGKIDAAALEVADTERPGIQQLESLLEGATRARVNMAAMEIRSTTPSDATAVAQTLTPAAQAVLQGQADKQLSRAEVNGKTLGIGLAEKQPAASADNLPKDATPQNTTETLSDAKARQALLEEKLSASKETSDMLAKPDAKTVVTALHSASGREAGMSGLETLSVATHRPPTATHLPATAGTLTQQTAPQALNIREKGWEDSFNQNVQWMVGKDIKTAHIRISPAELGPVQVEVSLQKDQLTLHLNAHHAITRDTLEAAIPRLRAELSNAGYNQVSIDMGQQNANQQHSQQSGAQANESSGQQNTAPTQDHTDEDLNSTHLQTQPAATLGLVDTFA